MPLIQFTKNHTDHSTDKGYQFEFFCDRCGNGFMTGFKPSLTGYAGTALRAASDLFGGVFGRASAGAYEIERAVQGSGHDKAFQEAVDGGEAQLSPVPQVREVGMPHDVLEPEARPLLRLRARCRNRDRRGSSASHRAANPG